jgi:hypothetical protein
LPFFVSVAYATNRSSSETATSVASDAVIFLPAARSAIVSVEPVSFVLSALGAGDADGDAAGAGEADAAGAGESCGAGSPLGCALGFAAAGDALGVAAAGDVLGAGDGSARYAITGPPFFATAMVLMLSTNSAGFVPPTVRMPTPFLGCCASGFFAFFAASTSFFGATCVNTTNRPSPANAGALPRASRCSPPPSRSRTTSVGSPSCGARTYARCLPSSESLGVRIAFQPS